MPATCYNVPDASGYIKLDAMENPYELPDALRRELAHAPGRGRAEPLSGGVVQHPQAEDPRTLGVPAGFDVILGNGSDEIISIIATATSRHWTAIPGAPY